MGGAVIVIENDASWTEKLAEAVAEGKTACARPPRRRAPPCSAAPHPCSQVVVDFTATWCGPCRMIGPVFEQLSTKFPSLLFFKVDVDACQVPHTPCRLLAPR